MTYSRRSIQKYCPVSPEKCWPANCHSTPQTSICHAWKVSFRTVLKLCTNNFSGWKQCITVCLCTWPFYNYVLPLKGKVSNLILITLMKHCKFWKLTADTTKVHNLKTLSRVSEYSCHRGFFFNVKKIINPTFSEIQCSSNKFAKGLYISTAPVFIIERSTRTATVSI